MLARGTKSLLFQGLFFLGIMTLWRAYKFLMFGEIRYRQLVDIFHKPWGLSVMPGTAWQTVCSLSRSLLGVEIEVPSFLALHHPQRQPHLFTESTLHL